MKYRILVIGRNAVILHAVIQLINNMEWAEATGAMEDEAAIELFYGQHFDLVLLGAGVDQVSENRLKKLFTFHTPGIKMARHYGDGSGMLQNELRMMVQGCAGDINVADNPFSAN